MYTAYNAASGAPGSVPVGSKSIPTPAETVLFGAAKQVQWGRNCFFFDSCNCCVRKRMLALCLVQMLPLITRAHLSTFKNA